MRPRSSGPIRAFVLFLSALAISACTSLLGDFEVGPGGDGQQGGCQATEKSCGGRCVSKEDPTVGCGLGNCDPCPARPNATSSCAGGACSFTCSTGFADCDANPENGCEKPVSTDPGNCGGCGKVCGDNNTMSPPRCEQGVCKFDCRPAFAHCGMVDSAGCETNIVTDKENCGRCAHSCLGGNCATSKCQPFQIASVANPEGLALDTNVVYFTTNTPLIGRVGRDGKCPSAPCPQDFAGSAVGDNLGLIRGPKAIVTNGAAVFWGNSFSGNIGRRAAMPPLAPITTFGNATLNLVGGLVLAGGKIFWTDGFENAAAAAPHVYRANPDGTNIEVVANYASPASTFDGEGGITADATHVYWASPNSGVWRAALAAAPCSEQFGAVDQCTSIPGGSGAFAITVDDTFVYWTEPGPPATPNSGTIKKAPKNGGASTFIAMNQDNPRSIAVMDGFVYWGNHGPPNVQPPTGSLRRAPQVAAPCNGNTCELVAPVESADALVTGSDGLYWTNRIVAGGVYRLAK